MRHRTALIAPIVLLALLCAPVLLLSEKLPEDKDKADQIVTGKVMAVFSRTVPVRDYPGQREMIEYLIELEVQAVHHGKQAKPGERFYIHCFKVIPIKDSEGRLMGIIGMNGHRGVPETGQTIKAYTRKAYGRDNGLYPDWFEVVDDKAAREKD